MFGLDPLSQPVAVTEMLILLLVAALIGWLLGRLVRSGRVSALRAAIASQEAELDECRRSKGATAPAASRPVSTPVVTSPVMAAPEAPVTADPLAPVYGDAPALQPVAVIPPEPVATTPPVVAAEPVVIPPLPASPPPVEIPPLGAPIPESPAVLPPMPATSLAGNSEAAVLARVASRAGELNFDRIGRALASEADDLKDIVGIGPFLERKLHSLGIYTFRQVGNFNKEDIDKVNEIIEFFPGRIERDNWVDQAKAFYNRKYGSN
ncbi:hypothetical protein GCM10027578_18990 [Spirosoma luteolum]